MGSIEKRKSFKAGLTKQTAIELSVFVIISASIIFYGTKSINSPGTDWYNSIIAGYIFLFTGIASIAAIFRKYSKDFRQYLIINPKGVVYQKDKTYFSEEWDTLKISFNSQKKPEVLTLRSSDSQVDVKRKYFPKFDIMIEILKMGMNSVSPE